MTRLEFEEYNKNPSKMKFFEIEMNVMVIRNKTYAQSKETINNQNNTISVPNRRRRPHTTLNPFCSSSRNGFPKQNRQNKNNNQEQTTNGFVYLCFFLLMP